MCRHDAYSRFRIVSLYSLGDMKVGTDGESVISALELRYIVGITGYMN